MSNQIANLNREFDAICKRRDHTLTNRFSHAGDAQQKKCLLNGSPDRFGDENSTGILTNYLHRLVRRGNIIQNSFQLRTSFSCG